jgi:hypothetical protein
MSDTLFSTIQGPDAEDVHGSFHTCTATHHLKIGIVEDGCDKVGLVTIHFVDSHAVCHDLSPLSSADHPSPAAATMAQRSHRHREVIYRRPRNPTFRDGHHMKGPLILKRASASRPSGEWNDDDYDVLVDGKIVSRIYEQGGIGSPPELRWFWSVTAIVPATKGVTNGHAATREEAMAAFAKSWRRE